MALLSRRAATLAAFFSFRLLFCPGALALLLTNRAVAPEADELSVSPVGLDLQDSALAGCRVKASPLVGGLLETPRPLKIHVHLHKAGGSLMCSLAKQAGERAPKWNWVEGANCNWMQHDDLEDSGMPERFPSCATRLQEYTEHNWTYTQIEREIIDGDLECTGFHYSCLLREPLDLIESNINYEEKGHWGPGKTRGENASMRVGHMRNLVAQGLSAAKSHWDFDPGLQPTNGWKFMDNMQVRLLAGALNVPPGNVTKEHFETAKHRLAKFHIVAKLEDMDDPVKRDHIFKKMGWDISLEDDQCNSAERSDPLPQVDRLWLRELNKWDYELYRWLDEPKVPIDLQVG